ncbi:sulfhydryl oxidase 1 isoform X1 [Oryzias latipes]|uniref:Sulfhydryl oxidase n=1 Tax=Oryzias latipes TaxID=8090 RepID=H2MSG5_ORYLA|nr:sulfhydryl oxidase 1 isoform X1 [Oryzias latipes]
MARRCSRATSQQSPVRRPTAAAILMCFCLLPSAAQAGLYTASDQITLLTRDNVESVLVNSTAAAVVEFYASWCGHCISFSPVYKSLARDISEWRPAVSLAAVDCAAEENRKICVDYKIRGFPSIKFFRAFSKEDSYGTNYLGFPRDISGLRHAIIDSLETHGEPWPPSCPPLEPISPAEVDVFFGTNPVQYLALIFEESRSYVGREVILDLLQFENITVRRVLSSEVSLVTKLGVTEFPSCYLYYPDGQFSRLQVSREARSFYTYALMRLPGVLRSGKAGLISSVVITNSSAEPWRSFNRTRVYMADLESTLHYALRVELAAHSLIKGEALTSLKNYIAVLAKYFPGRSVVMNLLKSLNSWLQNQTADHISYEAFREMLDNTAQVPDAALPEGERWVGCQGSQPHFRRYPCGVWTLFHVLTVQADSAGASNPHEVLSVMRSYVKNFFGCRDCADHFETMAREGLRTVSSPPSAMLWLWSAHNRVNSRIAGALSEDPHFPKIQWPPPEMCSSCHAASSDGEHRWNTNRVLSFLSSHFSSSRILNDYLEDESQVLEKQRQKHEQQLKLVLQRKAREASNSVTLPPSSSSSPSSPLEEDEEEKEEEEPDDGVAYEEDEVGEEAAAVREMEEKSAKPKPKVEGGADHQQRHKKPSFVGLRMREPQEDIVDLDSFVNKHFGAKVLQFASSSLVKQRTLQRKVEQEPRPVFGLSLELDAGVGMVGLQPIDQDLHAGFGGQTKRLQKRELAGRYFEEGPGPGPGGRWISVLSVGFSKLDVSLCVVLYFLSTACLLGMYLFFRNRLKRRRIKLALP